MDIVQVDGDLGGIALSVGSDGFPYATYKVGADTVRKKLGSTVISLGTGTSFNVTSQANYRNFTVNNFVVEPVAGSASGGSWNISDGLKYGCSATWSITKSYNASTGVLSAYMAISGKLYNEGWNGNCFSGNKTVKAYLII